MIVVASALSLHHRTACRTSSALLRFAPASALTTNPLGAATFNFEAPGDLRPLSSALLVESPSSFSAAPAGRRLSGRSGCRTMAGGSHGWRRPLASAVQTCTSRVVSLQQGHDSSMHRYIATLFPRYVSCYYFFIIAIFFFFFFYYFFFFLLLLFLFLLFFMR